MATVTFDFMNDNQNRVTKKEELMKEKNHRQTKEKRQEERDRFPMTDIK
jgi:hypothetical protein